MLLPISVIIICLFFILYLLGFILYQNVFFYIQLTKMISIKILCVFYNIYIYYLKYKKSRVAIYYKNLILNKILFPSLLEHNIIYNLI